MNAHKEQHDPACIAAYEQLFQADSRDPSQTERLAVWAMSWNAARAAEPSPVVKQNLTTQPAAAQEAVGFQIRIRQWSSDPFEGPWLHPNVPNRKHYDSRPGNYETRSIYAAPVTAAPANHLHAHLLHMLGAKDHEDACRIIGELHAAAMRTTAAPGIDMGVPGATLTIDGKTFTVDEVRAALLPGASPKDELESWKRGTKACAEVLGQVMRQTQDSPKGGSDAQVVPYQRALDLIGDAYNAGTHGIGYSQQAMELHDAMQPPAAPGIDLEPLRDAAMQLIESVRDLGHHGGCRCWQYGAAEERCDCGLTTARKEADALESALAQADASPKGVSDPWRGLYAPERAPTRDEYGCFYHPDIPSWDDEREESIAPLLKAQGFDLQCVPGDFSDEAMEEGGERYWQEMREWSPEPVGDGWRLVAIYDTEDRPYAMFVKPLAQAGDVEVRDSSAEVGA